ncbi:MAG TPA: DUF1295 domain-containing protein [Myxococcota bacterium]|nr:DUF1295 domain-containing protein [Myxococcota bacterium]
MAELEVLRVASWVEIGLAAFTALALLFISAPYGRHAREGWGPTIPSRFGWVLMELPTVLVFGAIHLHGDHRFELVPLLLVTLWQGHYVYRTFVYPFLLRGQKDKTMPLSIALIAVAFNTLNSYINARWISHFGDYEGWLAKPWFWIGLSVFVLGWAINTWADHVLRKLRAPGDSGYSIPRGGLYEYVSCPNYLGEIIEWTGWAIATLSLPGLAFALYTAANVGPRARTNHQWYLQKFPDYPRDRKRLIPFLW